MIFLTLNNNNPVFKDLAESVICIEEEDVVEALLFAYSTFADSIDKFYIKSEFFEIFDSPEAVQEKYPRGIASMDIGDINDRVDIRKHRERFELYTSQFSVFSSLDVEEIQRHFITFFAAMSIANVPGFFPSIIVIEEEKDGKGGFPKFRAEIFKTASGVH